MKKPFKFKQFIINQDRCAMKVGTDGVLLGAWVSLDNKPDSILDVGSGTGLIALQMAQRSVAETIDAIELDPDAYEQCVENFETSPWSDRLFCYHASFQEFYEEMDDKYDLIVSNPPFFTEEVASGNLSRDVSRQNASLPFENLLQGAIQLLSPNGNFAVIIPFKEEHRFVDMARQKDLFPNRITRIKGNPNSVIKRSLLQFSFEEKEFHKEELVIETERHQFTKEYIDLTKDFYLKM